MDAQFLNTFTHNYFNEAKDKILGGEINKGTWDMYDARKAIGFCWAAYEHLGLESLSRLCTTYLEHLHLTPAGARQFQKAGRRSLQRCFRIVGGVEDWISKNGIGGGKSGIIEI
tara:strand:+ start:402 stop:743 length:342 start_codon:yes stop_codon:yes gene_type:complete